MLSLLLYIFIYFIYIVILTYFLGIQKYFLDLLEIKLSGEEAESSNRDAMLLMDEMNIEEVAELDIQVQIDFKTVKYLLNVLFKFIDGCNKTTTKMPIYLH